MVRGQILKEEVQHAQHRDERRAIKRCSTLIILKPSHFVKWLQLKILNESKGQCQHVAKS